MRPTYEVYVEKLINEGILSAENARAREKFYEDSLAEEYAITKKEGFMRADPYVPWTINEKQITDNKTAIGKD